MPTTSHFGQTEEQRVRKLINENGFATVLSYPEPFSSHINHFPMIYSQVPSQEHVLIGHMAKKNPQWRHFKENPQCTLIFTGPNTYITPSWYSVPDVPTWNYAVVHLHGHIELVEKYEGQVEILRQLSGHFEQMMSSNPWEFELPEDLREEVALESAIISFKFHVEKVDTKFKFSQNHSKIDQERVIEGLLDRADDNSLNVRKWMFENLA